MMNPPYDYSRPRRSARFCENRIMSEAEFMEAEPDVTRQVLRRPSDDSSWQDGDVQIHHHLPGGMEQFSRLSMSRVMYDAYRKDPTDPLFKRRHQLAIGTPDRPQAAWDEYNRVRDALGEKLGSTVNVGRTVRRKRMRCEQGDSVDVERALNGDADCFYRRKRGAQKRIVRIAIDTDAPGAALLNHTSTNHFVVLAAITAAAAEMYENLGYGVEVDFATAYNVRERFGKENPWPTITVPVKRATDPLDISAILATGNTITMSDLLPDWSRMIGADMGAIQCYPKPMPKWEMDELGYDVMVTSRIHMSGDSWETQPELAGLMMSLNPKMEGGSN